MIAFAILRLHFLRKYIHSTDPTLASVSTYIWTEIQVNYSVMACTSNWLQPFMSAVSTHYGATAIDVERFETTKGMSAVYTNRSGSGSATVTAVTASTDSKKSSEISRKEKASIISVRRSSERLAAGFTRIRRPTEDTAITLVSCNHDNSNEDDNIYPNSKIHKASKSHEEFRNDVFEYKAVVESGRHHRRSATATRGGGHSAPDRDSMGSSIDSRSMIIKKQVDYKVEEYTE